MEAGLGGGSDLSEARRVGRGSEAFSGSALLSPPRRHRASPPVAYPRRAGPPRAAARGPWPLAVRSGGDGGSARGDPHEGRPISCRVFLIRSTARIRCGEVEHRAAGSASGGARGVGTWLVGNGGALGFVYGRTDGGCEPPCGVGWSDRVRREGSLGEGGGAECERAARNMGWGLGGVRNVQGWLRPFWGWDGWSAHTISFLSDFFFTDSSL